MDDAGPARTAGRPAATEIAARFERAGLPYAPIKAPHELLADPRPTATGGLAPMQLPDGKQVSAPPLPLMVGRERLAVRAAPPAIGAHTDEVLQALGYDEAALHTLSEAKVQG